jgi:hypothetical protein
MLCLGIALVCYRGHQGAMLNKGCNGSLLTRTTFQRGLHSAATLNSDP